jgi:hypothetical protein
MVNLIRRSGVFLSLAKEDFFCLYERTKQHGDGAKKATKNIN